MSCQKDLDSFEVWIALTRAYHCYLVERYWQRDDVLVVIVGLSELPFFIGFFNVIINDNPPEIEDYLGTLMIPSAIAPGLTVDFSFVSRLVGGP